MNKPQQPDKSLEQKIRGIIGDALASSCTREECPVAEMNCVECAVKDVLALLQPQQPEEGELVPNPYRCFCKLVRRMSDAEADEDYASHKFDAGRQAQLAHTMRSLKAQGWVKLPSEDELADMLEQVFASNTGQPHSAWPLNKIAQELRRLLSL